MAPPGDAVDFEDHMRYFPYEQPYENQREAMDRIANAFARGQDVLFEGACGTGKTLSALVPALGYAAEHDRTVVITTNVHQQMRQFVEEAKAIAAKQPIRAVVFRGKSSMCHIDVGYEECQVLRDATRDRVDLEGEIAELERKQRELLEQAQAGDESAADRRAAIMDELDELEGELADTGPAAVCEHFRNNLTAEIDHFYRWLYEDVRTPDDIYEYADQHELCGYELLKDGMDAVDLVICNYRHLLDPVIREQFFRWVGREPGSVVGIFDEAHNIEDAAREYASRTVTEQTIDGAIAECEEVDAEAVEPARAVMTAFKAALVDTYESSFSFGEREQLTDEWRDVAVEEPDGDEISRRLHSAYDGDRLDRAVDRAIRLGREIDQQYELAYRNGETDTRRECRVLQAATFLDGWLGRATDQHYYPVVSVRRNAATDEIDGRAELFACLPRSVTGPLFEQLDASVLMSATLRPFDVIGRVLGVDDPVTMAYGMTFPETRRRTLTVDTPPLFASRREEPGVQDTIAGVLADAVEMTPGNVLCFFPNYHEASRYHERLQGIVDQPIHLDRPGTRVEALREEFVAADRSVLCTSLWGTLTEGVSFDDDEARTAIVVGVPYPRLDDRMQAVQDAYAETFGDGSEDTDAGWRYAVQIPTIRKTRQAIGRVVRSPTDFAVRMLVDARYTAGRSDDLGKYSVHASFPPEEREEMIDVDPEHVPYALLNFYQDRDAYPDEPPRPG